MIERAFGYGRTPERSFDERAFELGFRLGFVRSGEVGLVPGAQPGRGEGVLLPSPRHHSHVPRLRGMRRGSHVLGLRVR